MLLAFANGLNQLYFYYETKASEEHNNCKGIRCERQNNAFSTLVPSVTQHRRSVKERNTNMKVDLQQFDPQRSVRDICEGRNTTDANV